jgi:hypothetical protein
MNAGPSGPGDDYEDPERLRELTGSIVQIFCGGVKPPLTVKTVNGNLCISRSRRLPDELRTQNAELRMKNALISKFFILRSAF